MSDGSYYDTEAPGYDETRGGVPRARAAAAAVAALIPTDRPTEHPTSGPRVDPTDDPARGTTRGTAVDVAGGTGIVSAELAGLGFDVLVTDLSVGMLALAAERLPGRVFAGSADLLALRDGCVDLVTAIWLLHLLPVPVADRVVAEAARVLRPGGHFVTTIDKDLAHGRARRTNADHAERVAAVAGRCGLGFVGTTSFEGSTRWASADGGQVFAVSAFRKA